MNNRVLFVFLVFAAVLLVAPEPLNAACMECKLPPPYTAFYCGNTYYNAADGCLITNSGRTCGHVGSCSGEFGDPCFLRCPLQIWACGKPLSEEWRLDRVTVEVARNKTSASDATETRGSV